MTRHFPFSFLFFILFLFLFSCFTFILSFSKISSIKINQTKAFFLINFLDYKFQDGIFEIIANQIEAGKQGDTKRQLIADKISLGLNIYKIFNKIFINVKKNLPIFQLHFIQLKTLVLEDLYDEKDSYREILNFELPMIISNWIEFFNSKSFQDFEINLSFDDFAPLPQSILENNNIKVIKIKLSGPDDVKNHIAEAAISVNINNKFVVIQGIVERIHSIKNDFVPLFKDKIPLKVQLLGFLDKSLYFNKIIQRLGFDDFIKISLLYQPILEQISVKFNIPTIQVNTKFLLRNLCRLRQITGEAIWNNKNSTLNISNLKFALLDDNDLLRFLSANINLDKNRINFYIETKEPFTEKLIYSYWPREYGILAKKFLSNLIENTLIKRADFNLSLNYKTNQIIDLHSQLEIADANLKYNGLALYAKEIIADISTQNINLLSNKIKVNDKFFLNQLQSTTNFTKKTTDIAFKFNDSITNLAEILLDKDSHSTKGLLSFTSFIKIFWNNATKNINITNLSGIINNYKISSPFIKIQVNRDNIDLKGTVDCDGLLLQNSHLKLFNNLKKNNKIQTRGNLMLQIPAEKFQEKFSKYNLGLKGQNISLIVNFNSKKSGSVLINLLNTSLFNNLKFNKLLYEKGIISFNYLLDNNLFEIKQLLIDLPQVKAVGDIVLSNAKPIKSNIKVNKYYNSQIEIIQDKIDNFKVKLDNFDLNSVMEFIQKQSKKSSDILFDQLLVDVKATKLLNKNTQLFSEAHFYLQLLQDKIELLDGYAQSETNYFRLFFSPTTLAIIINNFGDLLQKTTGLQSMKKGNFALYATTDILDPLNIRGTLHMKNFTLLESSLLSTILRLYSIGGNNITSFMKKGINFSVMNCNFYNNHNNLHLDHCQAISDQVLLSADSHYSFDSQSGIIEGMVVPTSLVNLPIILLQKVFKSKKNLLNAFERKKNFTVIFYKDKKPSISINPISVIMPSIFNFFLASNKTIEH
jgi:hypothetical protein